MYRQPYKTMKKYIGTKVIEAEPMTMGEADEKCLIAVGGKLSKEERSINGYYVKYDNEIESWLSKDEFEKAYKVADTFKDRLIIERDELVDRHCKLGDFLSSENFEKVVQDEEQRDLLCQQYKAMGEYLMILKRRIETIK